jgi:hypothetical protein
LGPFLVDGSLKSEKREGDGRENEKPSRVSIPLYKGISSEKGRKGGIFLKRLKKSEPQCLTT